MTCFHNPSVFCAAVGTSVTTVHAPEHEWLLEPLIVIYCGIFAEQLGVIWGNHLPNTSVTNLLKIIGIYMYICYVIMESDLVLLRASNKMRCSTEIKLIDCLARKAKQVTSHGFQCILTSPDIQSAKPKAVLFC